jgi:trans-aconitate methyltransferase
MPTPEFDTSVAHPARVWNYWLGGKDNYAADRAAGDRVLEAMPSMRATARATRSFLVAAVHHLAADLGVRQFLDIGTGLPTANNTHEIAQRAAPESRIVYVDNDPIVLAHARALLTSARPGVTAYVEADLRDVGKILAEARPVLDFSQPVALVLLQILHFIPDTDDPYGIVAQLLEPLPPGSFLVLAHATLDLATPGLLAAIEHYNQSSAVTATQRTRAEITRFFDGLDLIGPGVVPLGYWRPAPVAEVPSQGLPVFTAVGRKP